MGVHLTDPIYVKTVETDDRGRAYLGAAYQNHEVRIALQDDYGPVADEGESEEEADE